MSGIHKNPYMSGMHVKSLDYPQELATESVYQEKNYPQRFFSVEDDLICCFNS